MPSRPSSSHTVTIELTVRETQRETYRSRFRGPADDAVEAQSITYISLSVPSDVVYRECSVSPPEQSLDFLQEHLPLLALTNHEAKPLYLNGVVRAVRAAMKGGGGGQRLEQARQLLGLLAVHPVLTRDDKRSVALSGQRRSAVSGHNVNEHQPANRISLAIQYRTL